MSRDLASSISETNRRLRIIENILRLSGAHGAIDTLEMCDDINGDGSLIVRFKRIIATDSSGTVTILADMDDNLSAPYTAINAVTCCSIGNQVSLLQKRIVLVGDVWSPTGDTQSYTYNVKTVNDANDPPTYTDSDVNVTDLYQGEIVTVILPEHVYAMDTAPVITAGNLDVIIITYTTLV